MPKIIILAAIAALAACTPAPDRLAMVPVTSQLSLQAFVGSVLVRTVSLPTYAAAEEISREGPDGLIVSNDTVLWADDPQRGVTMALARSLGDILNVDVGAEPWPYVELADVSVDVRVTRMLAGADGMFQLSGQFFVGGDRISYRNSSDQFAIEIPMTDQSLGSIATAQGQAFLVLSEQIARRLGR